MPFSSDIFRNYYKFCWSISDLTILYFTELNVDQCFLSQELQNFIFLRLVFIFPEFIFPLKIESWTPGKSIFLRLENLFHISAPIPKPFL